MQRSILFVTGTRADFSKLEPLARLACDAGFEVAVFVTGMHMFRRHGLTKREVRRMKGVRLYEYPNQQPGDPLDRILANTVQCLSSHLKAHGRPDLVVIHGDRIEALACAVVTATSAVRTAHIEGGEVSGTIDESLRHCVTKLSDHHFVSSETARRRVMALGEAPDRIHVIGSPELDLHAEGGEGGMGQLRSRYKMVFDDYGIVLFHPVTSETAAIRGQAKSLFGVLSDSRRNFVVIAPNNDPGSERIFTEIDALDRQRFHPIASMPFRHFSVLLKQSACLVGNSSAGVRETPFLGLSSLNIGTRQTDRSTCASITHVDACDRAAVARFLETEWGRRYPRDTAFGTGNAAVRFLAVLRDEAFWTGPLQKRFHDLPPAKPGSGIALADSAQAAGSRCAAE